MSLFNTAKAFTDAAADATERLSQQLEDTANAAKQTAEAFTARGQAALQDFQQSARQAQRHTQAVTQGPLTAASQTLSDWQWAIAGAGTSGMVVANALKDLPRSAQALAQEMPKLARRIQRAGVRIEDAPRTDGDVMGLFNQIPGPSKLEADERAIRTFLADKHGSHIKPHSQGGSNGADNVVWEIDVDNLRRGAETMTGAERLHIRVHNAVDSVLKSSGTLAKLGVAATGTAVLTQAIVTALAHTLDLYRGDITVEDFREKIIAAAVSAGIATPVFFLIFVAVMALFPEVVVVLSAPAVIAGFNALFGVSIALPIIQSLIRHVEADGFGPEIKAQYQTVNTELAAMLQASSAEAQQWAASIRPA